MNDSLPTLLRRDPLVALSWSVLTLWLLGTTGAFWLFEMSDWRPFSASGELHADAPVIERWFHAHLVPATGPMSTLTVVHLYNPACRCNTAAQRHLMRLMDRYGAHGVRFVAALAPNYSGAVPPFSIPVLRSEDRSLRDAGIKSAPAALIFDAAGRLIYYGPYSDSAWCGDGGALVEPVLDRALSGLALSTRVAAARGCFCEW